MARIARGAEVLEMALEMIANARTVEELRQAEAVVLPLHCGLSLEQTAQAQSDLKKTPRRACRPRLRVAESATPQTDIPGRGALRAHQRCAPLLGAVPTPARVSASRVWPGLLASN